MTAQAAGCYSWRCRPRAATAGGAPRSLRQYCLQECVQLSLFWAVSFVRSALRSRGPLSRHARLNFDSGCRISTEVLTEKENYRKYRTTMCYRCFRRPLLPFISKLAFGMSNGFRFAVAAESPSASQDSVDTGLAATASCEGKGRSGSTLQGRKHRRAAVCFFRL